MPEAATMTMLRNAENANWVKQPQLKGQPRVTRVTLVNLAVVVALVQHAHVGISKTPKDKTNAVPLLFARPEKYPTTIVPAANCRRGVPAK